MEALLINVLNMSIAVSWLLLAVIVLRKLLKKVPRRLHCVLWALVAVRLLCPFSFESGLSLIPSIETIPPQSAYVGDVPKIESGIDGVDRKVNDFIENHEWIIDFSTEGQGFRRSTSLWWIGVVWVSGMSAVLLYGGISYGRLKKQVEVSLPKDGYYLCDGIESPFILGVIRPRIYLPSTLPDEQIAGVMAHEQAHLKRRDHWWKPMGYILLAVYWFHPLMWIGYMLFCRDVEMACDERVVGVMSPEERKTYSETLLSCSVSHNAILACPLAFGEVGVKERIKAVVSHRKPGAWVIAAALVICAGVALCFLTDPVGDEARRIYLLDGHTDCEGVDVQIAKWISEYYNQPYDIKSGESIVVIDWINRTGRTIHFEKEYGVYRKGLFGREKQIQATFATENNELLFDIEGTTAERKVPLTAYLSAEGEYSIRFTFYLDEEADIIYTAELNFRVGTVETDGYTECDGVDVRAKELVLEGEFPYIAMEWVNLSGKTVEYGLLHDLYYRNIDGSLERCVRDPEIMYDFILLKTAGISAQIQDLYGWDFSKAGTYVVTFDFSFEGEQPREEYNGYLEFTVP
ncbi:MAG: hypothetical protein IJZ85_12440 [Lachnospiraceae bacterium]|nr:hypothetical protein [Lachnospiraceae bacterium]